MRYLPTRILTLNLCHQGWPLILNHALNEIKTCLVMSTDAPPHSFFVVCGLLHASVYMWTDANWTSKKECHSDGLLKAKFQKFQRESSFLRAPRPAAPPPLLLWPCVRVPPDSLRADESDSPFTVKEDNIIRI